MNTKKVSIILPTYNGSKFIKQALNSVLMQSYCNWEMLIVDDGSIDNTSKIVSDFVSRDSRIIYLKNNINIGIQKTLNIGLKESKGEYIARIDDDDEWIDKDKLKKQIEFLDNNKDYALIGTGTIVANETGEEIFRYLPPETDDKIRNKLLFKNCFTNSSILLRRDNIVNLGGYNERELYKHIEDYYLCLSLGSFGKFYNIQSYSTKYTFRKNSISSSNKIDQFKKDIFLINEFRKKYPNYIKSLILCYVRLYLYLIFNFITPKSFKIKILKLYKKFY